MAKSPRAVWKLALLIIVFVGMWAVFYNMKIRPNIVMTEEAQRTIPEILKACLKGEKVEAKEEQVSFINGLGTGLVIGLAVALYYSLFE